jgi:molecular chaperone HscB
VPQSFDVSSALLSSAHRRLQQKLHPDRFAAAGPQARQVSAQLSAAVNAAYGCLLSPLSRARYLLSVQGQEQEEEAVIIQQQQQEGKAELLAEVMSLREELESIALSGESADSRLRLSSLSGTVKERQTALLSRLSSALQAHDWRQARQLVDELSFFSSIAQQCRQLQPQS